MEKPKILIVDDDPDLRRALKIRLRANHYETVQASDGYSAISVAQKEKPNLIILDLGLPAGDARLLREMLGKEGAGSFELTHLLRLSEAVAHLANEGVDVLLLDLGLPDGMGLDTVRQALAMAPGIPVIVLTARDPQSNEQKTLQAGAAAFFQKPADNNELLDVIRATLPKAWPGVTLPS